MIISPKITLIYTLLFLLILVILAVVLWDKPGYRIAYIPVDILEWAFIGSVVSVLYRFSYQQNESVSVYLTNWMITKPIIGTVMGGLVYFLAVSGQLFLNGSSEIKNTQLLDVVAFIGGFSDKLSIGLIDKMVSNSISTSISTPSKNNKKT